MTARSIFDPAICFSSNSNSLSDRVRARCAEDRPLIHGYSNDTGCTPKTACTDDGCRGSCGYCVTAPSADNTSAR